MASGIALVLAVGGREVHITDNDCNRSLVHAFSSIGSDQCPTPVSVGGECKE